VHGDLFLVKFEFLTEVAIKCTVFCFVITRISDTVRRFEVLCHPQRLGSWTNQAKDQQMLSYFCCCLVHISTLKLEVIISSETSEYILLTRR
jgi:hypothetical protein